MGKGPFTVVNYQFWSRQNVALRVCFIRVQPETIQANFQGGTNSPIATPGNLNQAFDFMATSKRSRAGTNVLARGFVIEWISPPIGYDGDGFLYIPIVRYFVYSNTSIGSTGTYLGSSCVVVEKIPEYQGGRPSEP